MASFEKWKVRLRKLMEQDSRPGQIAAGLAVGVFIGCTPLYGLQTITALGIAFVLRFNRPACIAGLWIQNPVTMLPIAGISYKLGCLALGIPAAALTVKSFDWNFISRCAEPFLLGSMVTGLLAAVPSYLFCYLLVRFLRGKECSA